MIVSNLIAGEKYVFRVYARNSLNGEVPEDEWGYTETVPVQVISGEQLHAKNIPFSSLFYTVAIKVSTVP